MPTVADVMEWGSSFAEIFNTPAVREGFITGLAIGFVLPVGILLIWWIVARRRRRCKAVRIPGEGGDLIISSVAVREFIQRIVADFHELELLGVRLRQRKRATDIEIRVNAVPGANIKLLKEALKDEVRAEAAEKMGLDQDLGSVHVDVQKYSADERDIEKKARKTTRREPSRETAPAHPYDREQQSKQTTAEKDADHAEPGSASENKNDRKNDKDDTISLC